MINNAAKCIAQVTKANVDIVKKIGNEVKELKKANGKNKNELAKKYPAVIKKNDPKGAVSKKLYDCIKPTLNLKKSCSK